MSDPKSEDSFIDEIMDALEAENPAGVQEFKLHSVVKSQDEIQGIQDEGVEEYRSQDVSNISGDVPNEMEQNRLAEESSALTSLLTEEEAEIIIDANVNVNDLFNCTNVEIVYCEETTTTDTRPTHGFEHGEILNTPNDSDSINDIETTPGQVEMDGGKSEGHGRSQDDSGSHSPGECTSEIMKGNSEVINNGGVNNTKIPRRKRATPAEWGKNKTKLNRMTGKAFVGYHRKKSDDDKIKVTRTDNEREERKIGPTCDSVMCKTNKKRHCNDFTQECREKIFNEFWKMTWSEKEVFVACNTLITKPKKRTGQTPSRRSGTICYSFQQKQVCKKMFLNTLGINEWMAHNWIKKNNNNEEENIDNPDEITGTNSTDSNSNPEPTSCLKRKQSEKKTHMYSWFDSIPKLPSHYSRRDSTKLYLEPVWASKHEMYLKYKQQMTDENKPWGSTALFDQVFDELNLSIYSPRKDQCDLCCTYNAGNMDKESWDMHIAEKNRAREEKSADKQLAKDKQIYCLTMDLQAVKITPYTKASSMYFKTKLCSHNFTIYNLASHQCTNYWFNETECDLTANTFASCIIDYLEKKCLDPKLKIVIYSDGCTYQNRNVTMSNALLHFSVKNNVEVEQKYLVKGHTQMECDSVHAMIERRLKDKDIYIPFEFVKYTKEARQSPFPYDVEYLSHKFFLDYTKIKYYDSIRPGRAAGDPIVTQIHCLNYKPDGIINYKLSFDQEFKQLPRRSTSVPKVFKPPQLYNSRLRIPESKWKHLQDLKQVIPSDFHSFYDSIQYTDVETKSQKKSKIIKSEKRKNQTEAKMSCESMNQSPIASYNIADDISPFHTNLFSSTRYLDDEISNNANLKDKSPLGFVSIIAWS